MTTNNTGTVTEAARDAASEAAFYVSESIRDLAGAVYAIATDTRRDDPAFASDLPRMMLALSNAITAHTKELDRQLTVLA